MTTFYNTTFALYKFLKYLSVSFATGALNSTFQFVKFDAKLVLRESHVIQVRSVSFDNNAQRGITISATQHLT